MERFRSHGATLSETLVALGVASAMETKVKFGMGLSAQTEMSISCVNIQSILCDGNTCTLPRYGI